MNYLLAFDGGATRTRAGLYSERVELVAEAVGGPCNLVDDGLEACVATLKRLESEVRHGHDGTMACVCAAISGASTSGLGPAIAEALATAFGAERVLVASDVAAVLFANIAAGAGIVVVAGTGSSVFARAQEGRGRIFGGRGPVLGDPASAHAIAVAGLRAALDARDGAGPATALCQRLYEAAEAASGGRVAAWAARAARAEVAALCPLVFEALAEGDPVAHALLDVQVEALARQVQAARTTMGVDANAPVLLTGALFASVNVFRERFNAALGRLWPGVQVSLAPRRGHRAAAELAVLEPVPEDIWSCAGIATGSARLPQTEGRLAEPAPLDAMTALDIVRAMGEQDRRVAPAVAREMEGIARAIDWTAEAFRLGGRLVYVGAGTSGRLGVIDAAECPPTFGVSPDKVVALIAGGVEALRRSIEGAEDDEGLGRRDVLGLNPPVGPADVVTGISASGGAPYVRGALAKARAAGAKTVLVCCTPNPAIEAHLVIAPTTGAEILAGSTRLKAGTATKMILNMISTGAMARSGLVYDGLMVNVRPVNAKLRDRAERIVQAVTGIPRAEARAALDGAGYRIGIAAIMVRKQLDATAAEDVLKRAGGSLRAALDG
ncbi:MAG TPA: N-acetylmuramic acid 6-phosphate etherase [Candidatus Hydrogenedentes bacterium]|nr:N-acetylmuramic acid 6-phosphate etherase [Candidatus Hydrogenedentota bacterium]HPG66393.1 N-acetylmuramic acid 6-phosphate etherase [Candidatus Hydrogenedentota bacterium]